MFDDGIRDVLTGSKGDDWFFARLTGGATDKVKDKKRAEVATGLQILLGG